MVVDAKFLLAGLFHDPPWKPWAINKKIKGGKSELLKKVEKKVGNDFANNLFEDLKPRDSKKRLASHELQSLILLKLLAERLKAEGLTSYASIAEGALKILAEENYELKQADILAAAVDRGFMHELYKIYLKNMKKYTIVVPVKQYINPFNPNLVKKVEPVIDADKLADFIVNYTNWLVNLLKKARNNNSMLIVHLAYLLLEPAWYEVMGPDYVPPADTRIPHHTVFDHVNAVLTTLLWVQYEGQKNISEGCLVHLSPPAVQAWIRETRRLRDLWAASWLASFLTWKAVEELVLKYGPGVLIRPPARLHPYYTARILSELNLSNSTLGITAKKLGLPFAWPVDPTVPASVLIALPREVCEEAKKRNKSIEELLYEGQAKAWETLLSSAVKEISTYCTRDCPLADTNIQRLASSLEPPLALRVRVSKIEDAYKQAEDLVRQAENALKSIYNEKRNRYEVAGKKGKISELDRARNLAEKVLASKNSYSLFYFEAIRSLENSDEPYISFLAAGSSPGYSRLASELYKWARRRKTKPENCTVCGRNLAVVYGDALGPPKRTGGKPDIAFEVGGDRLCPYCLVKRLTRRLLQKGLDRGLVGLPLTGEAVSRLSWTTVDAFTEKATVARARPEDVANLAYLLVQYTGRRLDALTELAWDLRSIVAWSNQFLDEDARNAAIKMLRKKGVNKEAESYIAFAEALLLEAIHDASLPQKVVKALSSKPKWQGIAGRLGEHLTSIHRRYQAYAPRFSILSMDADHVKKIIAGEFGLTPDEYSRKVYRFPSTFTGEAREAAVLVNTALAKVFAGRDRACKKSADGEDVSTIVSPSMAYALSRSLAVISQMDRRNIEAAGGALIYTGGDDLLAILPPSGLDEEGKLSRSPALKAATEARRYYWGIAGRSKGFLELEADGDKVATITPALAAYGRSGVLVLWRSKSPLWSGLTLTRDILSEKDRILTRLDSRIVEKDVLALASDAAGAMAVPLRLPDSPAVASLLDGVATLFSSLAKGALSINLLYDLQAHVPLILSSAEMSPRLGWAIVEKIFSSNLDSELKVLGEILGKASITESQAVSATIKVGEGLLSRLMTATGYAVSNASGAKTLAILSLAASARILKTGISMREVAQD